MTLLAHGGIPGLIAETSLVSSASAVFGYFVRRSAKKEGAGGRTEAPLRGRARRAV